jgi:hypothetical protein
MKILLTVLLIAPSFLAFSQLAIAYEESLYMNYISDEKELNKIKINNELQIKFVKPNGFVINGIQYDSTALESELEKILMQREKTKNIIVFDSKERLHTEYLIIVGQLHRTLMRVKNKISLRRYGIKYKEIENQKDVDAMDEIVPYNIIVVD